MSLAYLWFIFSIMVSPLGKAVIALILAWLIYTIVLMIKNPPSKAPWNRR